MVKSLQICGTSGSGKTTLVRGLFNQMCPQPIMWLDGNGKDKPYAIRNTKAKKVAVYEGEHCDQFFLILGSYETTCGGCDTIPSVKIVARLLDTINTIPRFNDHVCIFEGLMLSHMIGTVGAKQEELGLQHHWRAYLDTPLNVCLDRVAERRRAAGNTKPFNPANTQKDWPRVRQSRENWMNMGGIHRDIDHADAEVQFHDAIRDLIHA